MSTGVQTLVGKFVWHDNVSTDVEKAKRFYTELLGWETEVWKPGEMDYPMIMAGGQMHGGFGPAEGDVPSHWLGHVLVDNVDETAERAKSAGGKVVAGPFDIPEVGRMAAIADPQGAVFSVFSPFSGDGQMGEGQFVWDELVTSDVEGAKRFYKEVFGWTSRDMDMGEAGTYTMFQRAGDVDAAGAMTLPDPAPPPHWLPYVGTDDVDATASRVPKLGGTVIREPFDVSSVGRIAIVKDPNGAVFGLFTPSNG